MNYVTKNGNVNKAYANKVWLFMINTVCEQINDDLTDAENDLKFNEFYDMLNNIAKSK